jgi:pantoate--beta-alanine ligase
MLTVESIPELRIIRASLPSPVGLVPTMGFLHDGHLSLVRKAADECASIVVSIFVNPTQFGPQEDFGSYPRDIPEDLKLLDSIGVNLVWIPDTEEIYPTDFQTWVEVDKLSRYLEGKMRPGHFRGVATVVTKLFTAVQPDKAYFGQKDAQQSVIIKRLVRDLNLPVEIVICPIQREADGLAMSSRNIYLTLEQRKAAVVLYKSLKAAETAFHQDQKDADRLREVMLEILNDEPLAEVQYVSCADRETLEEQDGVIQSALLSMAVKFGRTRLIDNLVIGK